MITTAMHGLTLGELRHLRRVLIAEQATVSRWRRLVRARLDLAIATAAMPDVLGMRDELTAVTSPPLEDLPTHPDLVRDVLGGGPSIEVDRLEALRAHDRRLARYETGVTEALERATTEFIRRVAADPEAMLRAADLDPDPPTS